MTIKTFGQIVEARQERSRNDYRIIAERNRVAAVLAANPGIGVLCREGGAVYYVNFPTYREARDPAELVGA